MSLTIQRISNTPSHLMLSRNLDKLQQYGIFRSDVIKVEVTVFTSTSEVNQRLLNCFLAFKSNIFSYFMTVFD